MPIQMSYHSSLGGFDYLALRRAPSGAVEIVYDDGVKRRMVWRVRSQAQENVIGDVLRHAVNQTRVLPALYSELKRRSIAIEAVA
ncbi:hypothetical protein R5H32_04195 [Defluviimonas sp. D31]|uniref:hypothetical protein n=1 Tax=Defluviimonas sp. D31 TaxID=3083253 RepID=UPI00296F377D|nr:hypothetical protein [Defluviimonas sp. D31]MDW4548548.1 hypothetical protein [Defluviimonas sp. D31]